MLRIVIFSCLALVAVVTCGSPKLKWPTKYSVEVTMISVKSDLVEDMKIWKTNKQSRVEFNQGAVNRYIFAGTRRHRRPKQYEVHPETTAEELNHMVCSELESDWSDPEPYALLPVDDFVEQGEEMMKDMKCTKFTKVETSEYIESVSTLWATYDHSIRAWFPVRYESKDFNTWLGYNDKHYIVDYDNFQKDFNEKDIFNIDELHCSDLDSIKHNIHDEAVTKHLHFLNPENETHVDYAFEAFKKNHNKTYAHETEHTLRKRMFQNNMRLVVSTNRRNLGYKLAINQFSDRFPHELKRSTGLLRRSEGEVGTHPFPYNKETLKDISVHLPEEHDLRTQGLVSPIENQESCGSCWTYGTTAAVEGALARNNGGNLLKLSNQALIDCAWEFGAVGCLGGSDTAAYKWMMKYGLPTVADYGTYADQDGFCHIQNVTKKYPIRGFVDVTPNSVEALKVALFHHGPLSVSVQASDAFCQYSSGVFYDPSCDPKELDHEVTLVGYGSNYGDTFWILKNSWGPEWGIDGYMHISARDNNCGVMTEPTYVLF